MISNEVERELHLPITEHKGRGDRIYGIDTFYSGNTRNGFMGMMEFASLVSDVQNVYLATYPNRDRNMSIERVERMLSHPRTYAMLAIYEGMPVGFGVFPRLNISGNQVLYSSRGFVEEHEREGLGVYVLDRAMKLHDQNLARSHNSLRYGVLWTQNPASVVSLARTERARGINPFLSLGGRYRNGSIEQRIMLETHNRFRLVSRSINTLTGVIRGELWEVGMNENFRPDRNSSTWPIYQEMVGPGPEGLEMNREAGDLVIVTYPINPAADIATEIAV